VAGTDALIEFPSEFENFKEASRNSSVGAPSFKVKWYQNRVDAFNREATKDKMKVKAHITKQEIAKTRFEELLAYLNRYLEDVEYQKKSMTTKLTKWSNQ